MDRAATRAHHQAFRRGEAHRGGDASAIMHRAQTSSVAQVGDHDAAGCEQRSEITHTAADEFIGNPMKAISKNAFVLQGAGQRITARDVWLPRIAAVVVARYLLQTCEGSRYR